MKKRGIRRVLAFALAMLLLFSSLPNGESLFGIVFEKLTGESEQLTVKANQPVVSAVLALELYKVDQNGNPITANCEIGVFDKTTGNLMGYFNQDPGTNRYTWEDFSGTHIVGDKVIIRETKPPMGYQLSTLYCEMTYSDSYQVYTDEGHFTRYTIGILYNVDGTIYEGNITQTPATTSDMWEIINYWLANDPTYGDTFRFDPTKADAAYNCGTTILLIYKHLYSVDITASDLHLFGESQRQTLTASIRDASQLKIGDIVYYGGYQTASGWHSAHTGMIVGTGSTADEVRIMHMSDHGQTGAGSSNFYITSLSTAFASQGTWGDMNVWAWRPFNAFPQDNAPSTDGTFVNFLTSTGPGSIRLILKKMDSSGNPVEGCEFKVYSDAACTTEVTSTLDPTSTPVDATFTWDDTINAYTLILYGNIGDVFYIKETGAPDGWSVSNEVLPIQIVGDDMSPTATYYYDGNSETATGCTVATYTNNSSAELIFLKLDSETGKAIANDATFQVQDMDGNNVESDLGVSWSILAPDDENRKAYQLSIDTPVAGDYKIVEVSAPSGYVNENKTLTFTLIDGDNSNLEVDGYDGTNDEGYGYINNTPQKGLVTLTKLDIEAGATNKGTNGDSFRTGVIYGIFASNAINHPDGRTGQLFAANDLIGVSAIGADGTLTFDDLYLGNYYVKELYILNDSIHASFAIRAAGSPATKSDMYPVTGHLFEWDWSSSDGDIVSTMADEWRGFLNSNIYKNNGSTFTAATTLKSPEFTRIDDDSRDDYEYIMYPGYYADGTSYSVVLTWDQTVNKFVIEKETTSKDQIIKGKFTFYKETGSNISQANQKLEGAGFTIYKVTSLSKYSDDWVNPDGTFNIAKIRNAYLTGTTSSSDVAGNFYDETTGTYSWVDIYDFSGEEAAICDLYVTDDTTDTTGYLNDGSQTGSLTQFYYSEMEADILAGRLEQISGNHYRVAELFSDEYGMVVTPYIPFGDYIVVETTTPTDYEQALPFLVALYKDAGEKQVSDGISPWVNPGFTMGNTDPGSLVVKPSDNPYEAWYSYSSDIIDEAFEMRIRLRKYDADTQKEVLQPGAEYEIYRIIEMKNGNDAVVSAADFDTYKTNHPDSTFTDVLDDEGNLKTVKWSELDSTGYSMDFELRILGGQYYKCIKQNNEVDPVLTDTFKTVALLESDDVGTYTAGCVIETQRLACGDYLVEEVQAPNGYYNDPDYYITFKVTTDREFYIDAVLNSSVERYAWGTENYFDDETRGLLTIYKLGEVLTDATPSAVTNQALLDALDVQNANTYDFVYEEKYIGGAQYSIYAAEDILTPDYQYERDDTGHIIWIQDQYGYTVPKRTTWFKKGDLVAVIQTGLNGQTTITNVQYDPNGEASCTTTYDEATDTYTTSYYGVSTGTYNTYTGTESHPIVSVVVNREGKVTIELPLGKYEITESGSPLGFTGLVDVTDKQTAEFVWNNQDEQYVRTVSNNNAETTSMPYQSEADRAGEAAGYTNEGISVTNDRIKAAADVYKISDSSGQPLAGVVFGLFTTEPIYDYLGHTLIEASSMSPTLIGYGISDANGQVVFNSDIPIGSYVANNGSEFIVAGSTHKNYSATASNMSGTGSVTTKVTDADVLTGPTTGSDYELSGEANALTSATHVCTYSSYFTDDLAKKVADQSGYDFERALLVLINDANYDEGDIILLEFDDIYDKLTDDTPPATFEDEIDLKGNYVAILVNDVTGTYMLCEERATSSNTGNYIIRELTTDYGIWLEDDDYMISYHAYYDTDKKLTGTFNGSVAKAVETETDANGYVSVKNDITGKNYIANKATHVSLNKMTTGGAELPGASMILIDNSTHAAVKTWVSGTTAVNFEGLKINNTLPTVKNGQGTYTFRETAAPSGYTIAPDINFCLVRIEDPTLSGGMVLTASMPDDDFLADEGIAGVTPADEASSEVNQGKVSITENSMRNYTIAGNLSELEELTIDGTIGAHKYVGVKIESNEPIAKLSLDGGNSFITAATESGKIIKIDGSSFYLLLECDTLSANMEQLTVIAYNYEGDASNITTVGFVDLENQPLPIGLSGVLMDGYFDDAYKTAYDTNQAAAEVIRNADGTYTVNADLSALTSYDNGISDSKWISLMVDTMQPSIVDMEFAGTVFGTADVATFAQFGIPVGAFHYWLDTDDANYANGVDLVVTDTDGITQYTTKVYLKDTSGIAPSEPTAFVDYDYDVYVWQVSPETITNTESLIYAFGTYTNSQGQTLNWYVNRDGQLYLERQDQTVPFEFDARTYDDVTGDLTSEEMPWEQHLRKMLPNGDYDLDENGDYQQVANPTELVLDDWDNGFVMPLAAGYFEDTDGWTYSYTFDSTETTYTQIDIGWVKVNGQINMFDKGGSTPPSSPSPDTPKPSPTPDKPKTHPVEVSKLLITDGPELPGAKMVIYNNKGEEVERWISTTVPHVVQLYPGTYTLVEKWAQTGYATGADITFTVTDEDKVTHVAMIDDYTRVTVSKKDITTDEEIPGAVLTVVDEDNIIVDQWISGTTPHQINGVLEEGKSYTLIETLNPKGYAYSSSITFTVTGATNGKYTTQHVVMYDSPSAESGDTNVFALNNRQVVILIILGLGLSLLAVALVMAKKKYRDNQ